MELTKGVPMYSIPIIWEIKFDESLIEMKTPISKDTMINYLYLIKVQNYINTSYLQLVIVSNQYRKPLTL